MPYDAESGTALGKQINLKAMTVFDKVKAVAGTALATLVGLGAVDFGSDEVNGAIAFAAAVLLALGVKPLGPATE